MPLLKRTPFIPNPIPDDLRPDETVFYSKLTNEIFRDYEEYFERVILCNSLVWACSVTGKINLTFDEALQSERQAQKTVHSFCPALKKGLLYLINETRRGKVGDIVEDIFSYAKEHYFVGESVLGVIGNLWCHSRVIRVIPPTKQEIDQFRREKEAKGKLEPNDYLSDDTWGPPPDLFRYEVEETDPDDPTLHEVHILESIDVKREKVSLTKDKCRFLIKATSIYDEEECVWRVREEVAASVGLRSVVFDGGLFVGPVPIFESSPGPVRKSEGKKRKQTESPTASKPKPKQKLSNGNGVCPINKPSPPPVVSKSDQTRNRPKKSAEKKEKVLSPEELKRLELERRMVEKEAQKEEKKVLAEFKKLWLRPKEDLEVEDLQELPVGDPVDCKIPSELFGDFLLILEYLNCGSPFLRLRDSFPQGLEFDVLERALCKSEVAGPLSDILQLLLGAIFRLQEREAAEITQEQKATPALELEEDGCDEVGLVEQATVAATWPLIYQGLPLYQLTLDHLSLSELLRLHLLSSGARCGDKDVKWRVQNRGGYSHREDPGLGYRLEEAEALKGLQTGSVYELSVKQKLKLITCLIHQILSYAEVRDSIEQNFDQLRETRLELRTLQAAERRHETEDNAWKAKLKSERLVPPENFLKNPTASVPEKARLLSDDEIEGFVAKRSREATRRKENFECRIEELWRRQQRQERLLGLHPLGRDRAYRRYWLSPSVPALFVENEDQHMGPCCPLPTPHIPNVDIQDISFVRKYHKQLVETEEGKTRKKTKPRPASVAAAQMDSHAKLLTCSGGVGSCPVHSHKERSSWTFLWREDQLDQLIASLSVRGIREKELRQVLMDEAGTIRDLVKKCPAGKLNLEKEYPELAEGKKNRATKSGLDPNLNYPPKTPISTIMELQLRDLILEAEDKIFLGTLGSLKVKDRGLWVKALEGREYDAQTSELFWGDEKRQWKSVEGGTEQSVVVDLCCAILQLEQSVEPKFLKPPLGEEVGDKKKKGDTSSHLRPHWVEGSPLSRWETSLMQSTTFSQLFVHFFTLDKSISWNRSVLNARCRMCRRKGDAENMLLCDGCNKGVHAYCFKPPIDEIPKGDWFCLDCKPPPLPPSPKPRKGRTTSSPAESEDESMPVLEEQQILNEFCVVCGNGGEVICCDGCPTLYHLHCLHPPKQRVPRGLWYCDSCKEGTDRKNGPATSKATSSDSEEEDSQESSVEEEEEESVPVKVRFGASPRKIPSASEASDEEEELGRGVKRKCASKAIRKISKVAKRLRGGSKVSSESEASSSESSRGLEEESSAPDRKRTRLQRGQTDRCGDSGDLDNVLLDKLMQDLMRHADAWPFLKPVTKLDAPDYHDIVKTPMDLGTIKYKLNSMVYTCNQEFLADLHLVFHNCFNYNAPTAPVFKAGEQLKAYCKGRCEKAGLHFEDYDE